MQKNSVDYPEGFLLFNLLMRPKRLGREPPPDWFHRHLSASTHRRRGKTSGTGNTTSSPQASGWRYQGSDSLKPLVW